MNLKQGALLHNNTYKIEQVLGQGGFGITYLAVHIRLKKEVAIKEFFPKSLCNRDLDTSKVFCATDSNSIFVGKLKNKFLKEAEHIAEMESPYIVKVTDVFEDNDTVYYVMDYIKGKSLSDIVKTNGPLSERQAIEYITKIGEALSYIHSKQMNHLDVKPANIMIREKDNIPILVDFGLSKQYDSDGNQTSTTPVGISHGYAPVEQYNTGGVKTFSPQTDIYSLSATLYYMLSGITPPQATTLTEETLSFPNSIPSHLISPISKAMSPKRKDRYGSVLEFIDILNAQDSCKNEDTCIQYDTYDKKEVKKISRFITSYKIDVNKRNVLTNVVLHMLLIGSLLLAILIPAMVDRISYLHGAVFLLCVTTFVGVLNIIKWKKSGLSFLIISPIIIFLPLIIISSFKVFLWLSILSVFGFGLLCGILHLKRKGISTWAMCSKESNWLIKLRNIIIFIWLFAVIFLPFIVGLWTGFRKNIYSNGISCIDARVNSSPFYSYDLYLKILLGSDFSDDSQEKWAKAEYWLSQARYLTSDNYYEREFSEPVLFLNNLIFKYNNGNQEAIDYINSEKEKINMHSVFQCLNGEFYVQGDRYYSLYKDEITSLLNEAKVFDTEYKNNN